VPEDCTVQYAFYWASHGFDRATSNKVDNSAMQKPLGLGQAVVVVPIAQKDAVLGRRSKNYKCQ